MRYMSVSQDKAAETRRRRRALQCCAFSNGADMGADVPHDAMAVSLMFEMGLKAKDFGRLNEGTIKNEREV
jgi:hypothetical protein